MNQNHFDALTRSFFRKATRRRLLGGLVPVGLGLGAVRLQETAKAKKRRKRRKPKPNAFGCLNVGDPCKHARQCCSSLCQGKKGKKRCRAHDTGNCPAGVAPYTCDETSSACTTSLGDTGLCATTTGNAGYCLSSGGCYDCQTDAECQTAAGGFYGPRAACARCASCPDTGGTACVTSNQVLGISQDGSQGSLGPNGASRRDRNDRRNE